MSVDTALSTQGWSMELEPIFRAVRSGGGFALDMVLEQIPGRSDALRENPHRSRVEAEVEAICDASGLNGARGFHRRFLGGRLSALCFPSAPAEQLRLCHLAVILVFMFDDALDGSADRGERQGALAEAFKRALAGQPVDMDGPCPLLRLALRVRAELVTASPSHDWMDRFLQLFDHFVDAAAAARRRWLNAEKPPALSTYAAERYYDVAVSFVLALVELADGAQLTPRQWQSPRLASLRGACTFYIAFVNDLFSYHKEVLQRGNFNNVLAVLQVHEGLSFSDAVTAVVMMVQRCYEAFEVGARALDTDPDASAAIRQHVAGMHAWMQGSLQWSLETLRYRHPESPFPELRGLPGTSGVPVASTAADAGSRPMRVSATDAAEDRFRADSPSAL